LLAVYRLRHEVIHSAVKAFFAVADHRMRCHRNNRNCPSGNRS
jgi:DTW domain-containing protein YfiP